MATEETLSKVCDEIEIRNLIARLAHISDEGTADDYASCITEDSIWRNTIGPGQERRGRADCLEGLKQRWTPGKYGTGPGSNTRHIVSTTVVCMKDGVATAKSYVQLIADSHRIPSFKMMFLYEDEFRRTQEGWKLAQRQISHA